MKTKYNRTRDKIIGTSLYSDYFYNSKLLYTHREHVNNCGVGFIKDLEKRPHQAQWNYDEGFIDVDTGEIL